MIAGVLGNPHAVVHGVRGARRDEPHVGDGTRRPGVALVDHVAVLVELQAAVEMGAAIHRTVVAVEKPAVKHGAALRVFDAEFDPYVEGVDGAAGKKVTELARAHDDVEAHSLAGADERRNIAKRSHHVGRRHVRGTTTGRFRRLFAFGEQARRARLAPILLRPVRVRDIVRSRESENVDRQLAVAQEVLRQLQLFLIVIHERQRRVRADETMRAHLPVPRRRIG